MLGTKGSIEALKAKGKTCYMPAKSKDGRYAKTSDGTVYEITHGTFKKVGRLNGNGEIVQLSTMTKRQRSKLKRQMKREGSCLG